MRAVLAPSLKCDFTAGVQNFKRVVFLITTSLPALKFYQGITICPIVVLVYFKLWRVTVLQR